MTIEDKFKQWELEETKHSRAQIERLENIEDNEITLTFNIDDNDIKELIEYFKYFKRDDKWSLETIAEKGISLLISLSLSRELSDAKWKEREYAEGVKRICELYEAGEIDKEDLPDWYDDLEARVYGY